MFEAGSIQRVCLLYVAMHPWLGLFAFSISMPATSRALLLGMRLSCALVFSALFFGHLNPESTGDNDRPECMPTGALQVESLIQSFVVGFLSFILSCLLIAFVKSTQRRHFKYKLEWSDWAALSERNRNIGTQHTLTNLP